jgi:soluble lytic murein transglycosylase-like protein
MGTDMRYGGHKVLVALAMATAWLALATSASAQQMAADPVASAMDRIDAALGASAHAADTVIEASRHVSAGAEARKRGDRVAADAALAEAERVAAGLDGAGSSALAGELARAIAAEREALAPKPAIDLIARAPSRPLPRPLGARLALARTTLGPILAEERVPLELLSVAYVESGFNPMALSPKGARGIWQFMPATARRYGLAVDGEVDHRTHPERATRAAARYLRDLYGQFGDWKLALAAYNAGEGRVWGVIRRTGIRDFDEMSRRGLLPAETRAYVPSVLAVWSRLGRAPAPAK